jgi:cell wall-associated NlpC family hydrolase
MGATVLRSNMLGRPRLTRLAIALATLGLLGAAATAFVPAALAGSQPQTPPAAQAAGSAPVVPPPVAPVPPAPTFGSRPPAPPSAGTTAPPLSPLLPAANAEPTVRVVLAPDARGPLPPAVTLPASQVPASAVPPVPARAAAPGTNPATPSAAAGTFSLASVTAPAAGTSPARVEAGPSAGLRLASLAQTQLGARYTWGGTTPAGGFDCSGFVYWAYGQAGHPLPRVMTEQFASGRHVRVDELQPGDVLFFENTYTAGLSHNGIYVGEGKFVHAADESTGVVLTAVHSAYWEQHFAGAIRILE